MPRLGRWKEDHVNAPRKQPPQQKSLREIDFGYFINRYLNLFWRRKVYLLLSGPVAAVVAFVFLYNTVRMTPELETHVLIGVENPRQVSAVDDFANIGASKLAVLQSLNFLSEIVDSLSLRFKVPGYARAELFDSVYVDSAALPGQYDLVLNRPQQGRFTILFSNGSLGMQERVVETGLIATLDTLQIPGMYLRFTQQFLQGPEDVTMFVTTRRRAASLLQSDLTVRDRTVHEGAIIVSLKGRDYGLIADILNTTAELFVQRNQSLRKRRTRRALEILEKQLEKASNQLAQSENALRGFLSQNPGLGNRRLEETVADLSGAGAAVDFETEMALSEARRLQGELKKATSDNDMQLLREALAFLSDNRYYRATVIASELDALQSELRTLSESYSRDHPLIVEARAKSGELLEQTAEALNDFVQRTEQVIGRRQRHASQLKQQLRNLPEKERRLAELQSRQSIDSELYASILSRYNEAKVADAAEIADLYLLDRAYPPLAPTSQSMLLQFLAMSLVAGIGISFGPVVLFDILDKSARTEGDVGRLVDYPVLEAIPQLENEKEQKHKTQRQSTGTKAPLTQSLRRIDKNLVAAEISHSFVNETFKSLRTKLTLGLHSVSDKSIVVTSLNPGEGKSTMAGNIAISLAQQGKRTVLIDGDLRRGVLHNSFAVEKVPGLTECLIDERPLSASSIDELVHITHVPNLFLISTGQNQPNPIELLVSDRFHRLRNLLSERFDVIIMDSPPLGVGTDAVVLHEYFSRYILVAKAGHTNLIELKKRVEEYGVLNNKILGIILNYAQVRKSSKYYKYSKYYSTE